MIDWKNVGVPLITAVLVVLFGGTAIINYIVSAFLIPAVNVDLSIDQKNSHMAYISVTNVGRVSATGMTITIDSPSKISNYTIFSTENYFDNKNQSIDHPSILKIFVPRFVQGDGSLIRVNLIVAPKADIDSGQYNVYTTFDQGSVRKISSVNQKGDTGKPEIFRFTDSIVSTIAAAVSAVVGILAYQISKRATYQMLRKKRGFDRENESKEKK